MKTTADTCCALNACVIAAHLRREGGWFVCDVPQPRRRSAGCFKLLTDNGAMPGCARYCLTAQGTLRLRAEIPSSAMSECDEPGSQGAERNAGDDIEAIVACVLAASGGDPSEDAGQLCRESGWPFTERSGGRYAVELEGPPGLPPAIVSPSANGLDVSVDLLTLDKGAAKAPQCLEAVSLFLLRLSGAVRMVRPSAHSIDDMTVFRLGVTVPPVGASAHVSHAFAALSVAVGLSRMECRALIDSAIAKTYLMTG